MTQIITASTAGDFLALIPSMLGYRPSESVVLIPFHGTRSIGAMRVDLPDPNNEDAVASTMIGMIQQVPDVDAVAAIVYTDKPAGDVVSFLALVGEFAEFSHLIVRDLLFVAGDGYGSVNEAGMPLRPVSELVQHIDAPSYADHVLAGTELPEIPDDILMDVNFALSRLDFEDYDLIEWIENVIVIDQPNGLAPSDLAFGLSIMSRPSMRDIMISQTTGGRRLGTVALEAQLAWERGVEYPRALAMGMWGEGDQPEPRRLEATLNLARHLAACSGDAGAYSVAAWCSWALGRSTHAEHYAKQGLKQDPEHGLCAIVEKFILAGHLPAWAFQKRRG